MKWLIIYFLVGVLLVTLSLKAIFDADGSENKIAANFKKSAAGTITALLVVVLFWPAVVFYSMFSEK